MQSFVSGGYIDYDGDNDRDIIVTATRSTQATIFLGKKAAPGMQASYGLLINSSLAAKLERFLGGRLPPSFHSLPLSHSAARHLLQLVNVTTTSYNISVSYFIFGSDPVLQLGKVSGIYIRSPSQVVAQFGRLSPSNRF